MVGRLVARALGAPLVDVDACIEERAGSSVSKIFEQHGEETFRDQERRAVEAALRGDPGVIVPGGGWAAQPGNLAAASDRCSTVYLQTDPAEAADRIANEGGRPLLADGDQEERMVELLEARARFYERADYVVVTDSRSIEEVAGEVVALARSRAGW